MGFCGFGMVFSGFGFSDFIYTRGLELRMRTRGSQVAANKGPVYVFDIILTGVLYFFFSNFKTVLFLVFSCRGPFMSLHFSFVYCN